MLKFFKIFNFSFKKIKISDINKSTVNLIEIKNFKGSLEDLKSLAKQPIVKLSLSQNDKIKYIGDINLDDDLISRHYSASRESIRISYFFNKNEKLNLSEIVHEHQKTIILGNPGLGKTTELKKLAIEIWNDNSQKNIPVYKNLKNFTVQDDIEKYLNLDYKNINHPFFILDGIDEIKNIQDFTSKLESFIDSLDSNVKFILSCRTNVYESLVHSVSGFKIFYLQDLSIDEGLELLNNKCNFDFTLNFSHYEFLKNPFILNIFARYINENKKLPNNTGELWESYINERLKEDESEKLRKIYINPSLIKKYSKKISLINELMKTNLIDDEILFSLFPDNQTFQEYIKNPLIEKQINENDWVFEHRNIQEYFAAKAIADKPFQAILEFIEIEKTGKTHPSLFNTITFLINILDTRSPQFINLIDWLIINEPELLFKADSNRISKEISIKVFQEYFNKICIENTFWITHNRNISPEEIIRLGNQTENFFYLKEIIQNSNYHFRIIISAFELMGMMDMPPDLEEELKCILISQLNNPNIKNNIKAHIITFIALQNLHTDREYLLEVFKIFEDEDEIDIINSLIKLLMNVNNIDEWFGFLNDEFLRINNLKVPKKERTTVTSISTMFEDLILRIQKPENFLQIITYFFNHEFSLKFDSEFETKVYEKSIEFINNDSKFIIELIKHIKFSYLSLRQNNPLQKIITDTNSGHSVIEYLLNNSSLDKISYLVAQIVDIDSINLIINRYESLTLEVNDLETFRNFVGHYNSRELAYFFDTEMQIKGVVFKEPVQTVMSIQESKEEFDKKNQENFNLLFNKKLLIQKIKFIFSSSAIEQMSKNEINIIESEWYESNGHGSNIDSSIHIIRRAFDYSSLVNTQLMENLFTEGTIIMEEIDYQIDLSVKRSFDIKISDSHKTIISQWVSDQIANLDFNTIIAYEQNYDKLELIYSLGKIISFEFPSIFLLNSLQFLDINKTNDFFEFIKSKNDITDFNNKIISNIIEKKLSYFSLETHIKYAFDNNLSEVYPNIQEFFLNEKYHFSSNLTLLDFFNATNDVSFLIKCCNDVSRNICWTAIKILLSKDIKKDFLIKKAKELLDGETNYYIANALNILIKYNDIQALEYIIKFSCDNRMSMNQEYFQYYNNPEGISKLKLIYNIIFKDEDPIAFHHLRNFFDWYIFNLSKINFETYKKTTSILIELKNEIEEINGETFHINSFIQKSKESYINSQSKPLDFEEAKKKVQALSI